MTPDILVRKLGQTSKAEGTIAIELETDVDFDFGASLRQIRKYAERYVNVAVIIPKEYETFATLYKNQGFRILLWSAVRQWQCSRCGNIVNNEGSIPPKCAKCKAYIKQELVGLRNAKFEEFAEQP